MIRFKKENGKLIELETNSGVLNTLYVMCECSAADHIFRFAYSLDDSDEYIDDDLYLECILCPDGFWYRLKTAILYLLNYKSIQRWHTILITKNDAQNIKELCELYLRSNEEIKNEIEKHPFPEMKIIKD